MPILSAEQKEALARRPGQPIRVLDPDTNAAYVLVPADMFDRAMKYDDSPWTPDEMALLAAEAGRAIGWDEMDEYDNYPDAPK